MKKIQICDNTITLPDGMKLELRGWKTNPKENRVEKHGSITLYPKNSIIVSNNRMEGEQRVIGVPG